MGNKCSTDNSLAADVERIEKERRRQQLEESRAPIMLQIIDHAAGMFGTEIKFSAMLLGTVLELTAELTRGELIAAGTPPEEVAVSFGGETVVDPKSTTLEGLGVAEGGTLEIKVDGEAREARREAERLKRVRTDEDIRDAVDAWCNDPVSAAEKYGPIGEWDTSQVTSMRGLFDNKRGFNDDISQWDVSGVTDMFSMFLCASSFNQPVEGWSTGRVTDMRCMFYRAHSFNQRPSWATENAF